MFPCGKHPNHFFGDLAFFQEHSEYFVPENGFQLFEFQRRRNAKHSSLAIKTAIGQKNVAVGIESEKIAKGLDGNDRAGDGCLFRHGLLDKNLRGFPGAAAETGKKFSIIQKIPAKDFRDAENEMPVGHLLEDIQAEPFPQLQHALLVARRTEVPSFTRECQQVFMAAVFAFHPGKAVLQIAAVKITVNHLFDIRPPESVLSGKPVIINLHEGFKIILDAMIIIRILRTAGMV